MKKIIQIILVVSLLSLPMSAFAADDYTQANAGDDVVLGNGVNSVTVPVSSNVVAVYDVGGTAVTPNIYYSITTYNTKGTRTFATAQESSGIYYQETTAATIPAAASSIDWSTANWIQL